MYFRTNEKLEEWDWSPIGELKTSNSNSSTVRDHTTGNLLLEFKKYNNEYYLIYLYELPSYMVGYEREFLSKLQRESDVIEYILSLMGKIPFPKVTKKGWVRPDIYKEWQEYSGTEYQKRRKLKALTGVTGLTAKDKLSGKLCLKAQLQRVMLDEEIVYVYYDIDGDIYDRFKYYRYTENVIYSMKDAIPLPGYGDIPLLAIIAHFRECEDCGHIHTGTKCPVCGDRYNIREYSTKAENIFPFKKLEWEKHPEYMGIELEYEDCLDQNKAVIKALMDHAIIKRDGSIRNGFEICTAPATLASHKKAFEGFFEKVKVAVKANCGMHVHYGRKGLTEMQQGKLLSFLYKKENIPWISKLAGRQYADNHYCQARAEKGVTEGVYGRKRFFDPIPRSHTGKYEALNLSPTHTIEFRIFAPPKDERTLFARLEFVQALADWTKPGVCSVKEASNKDLFISFVKKYRKVYPYLCGAI